MRSWLFRQIAQLYAWLYGLFCGRLPRPRPWHYRWSAHWRLNADLRETLPLLTGRVLDVGGGAPYRAWCSGASATTGVAERAGPGVDFVVPAGQPWPLPTAAFDGLLCIHSLANATAPEHVVAEMARVLRPGGLAVISAPASGIIADGAQTLRTYSAAGLRQLLGDGFTVTTLRRAGGIGSMLALLSLGWVEALAQQSPPVRLLQFAFLPLWIGFSGALNLAGVLVDAVDPTHVFYSTVLVVVVRTAEPRVAFAGPSM